MAATTAMTTANVPPRVRADELGRDLVVPHEEQEQWPDPGDIMRGGHLCAGDVALAVAAGPTSAGRRV